MHASTSRSPQSARSRRVAGYSLIELMVCLVVVGVLSSVAYPAFSSTLATTRRADALTALLKVQMLQERFRADHPGYADLSQLGVAATALSRHYEIAMLDTSTTGYTVRASAVGGQQRDTLCRHLQLTVDGLNVVYASGATGDADNAAAANRRCWSL